MTRRELAVAGLLVLGGAGARAQAPAPAPAPAPAQGTVPGIDPRLQAAFARWQAGEREAAAKSFDALVAENPQDAVTPLAIADFLIRREQYAAAEPFARRGFALRPDLGPSHLLLGAVLLFTDRPEEAEAHYRAAVARFAATQDAVDLAFNLGMACALNNKRLEAAEWFGKAIAARPDSGLFQFSAAENWLNLRRLPEAEAGFRAARTTRPRHPDAGWKLAVTLAAAGRAAEAEPLFQAACREGPPKSRGSAQFQYAIFLYEQGRAAEAEPLLDRVVADRPDERMPWHWLARVKKALGKREEAVAAVQRYQELLKRHHEEETDYLLGLIREQLAAEPSGPPPPPGAGTSPPKGDKEEGSGGR